MEKTKIEVITMTKTTQTYRQFKDSQQEMFSNFPIFYAFSNDQFEEGKNKLGVKNNSELLKVGMGGYIKKVDEKAFTDLLNKMDTMTDEYMADKDNFFNACIYELANHEYGYAMDDSTVLGALNLKIDTMTTEQKSLYSQAVIKYMDGFEG
tara:strand:- start:584 stop:1036 length:453 start_codon:yes stop_codon:yes gene_type:complete